MFQFKQFTIHQDACAMKVGTDGVLLGAWCPVENVNRLLDIGTGTGLLALMIAQRSPNIVIDAVEIAENAADQAQRNIAITPWKNRIQVFNTSIQQFSATASLLYDAIVCNPPYFVDSLKSPDTSRTKARHNDTLTHEDLLSVAAQLLTEQGALTLILPTLEADVFIEIAKKYQFTLSKCTNVLPTHTSLVKRRLMQFVRHSASLVENQLVIETDRHVYSEDYKKLTQDFYLKF